MSDVINKTTMEIKQSVHTPSYMGGGWIVNPSFPNCEKIYYKIKADSVIEMTASEKTAKDAVIAQQVKDAQKELLIAQKQREISRDEAIQALKNDGVLDSNGDLIGV